MKEFLKIENLDVVAMSQNGDVHLLSKISLSIKEGEIFALIGESGSGKSTFAYSVTRLFPPERNIVLRGSIRINETDIVTCDRNRLKEIRRNQVRYIFQEPTQSFNPVMRIKSQIKNALSQNGGFSYRSQKSNIISVLKNVGIQDVNEVLYAFPHQLSTGTLQRIMIAMAILISPRLIIADEPTSAVDASMRYQILDLLNNIRHSSSISILLITHDLNLAQRYADRVAVIYAGRIIEQAPAKLYFDLPLHPYSQMLLKYNFASGPSFDKLPVVSGQPPKLSSLPGGCKFHPRCDKVQDDCRQNEPALENIYNERYVRCPYWK